MLDLFTQFIGIFAIVGTAAAFFACFAMDKFGRRQLFRKFTLHPTLGDFLIAF